MLYGERYQIATDHCSQLGGNSFKGLQIMKHAWQGNMLDHAISNSEDIEIISEEFKKLHDMDEKWEDES